MTKQIIPVAAAIALIITAGAAFLILRSSDSGSGAQQPSPHALDQSESTNPG
ncbi:hypothetical protein [Phyllobacterium sp. SB3]|uniref:hypothetical protein n=1 Tax=Phyllobacterium sp. SB3 TaxID=3156073 RepID=UPI0032AF136C